MKLKHIFTETIFLSLLLFFAACNPASVLNDDNSSENSSGDGDNDVLLTEAASDFIWENTNIAEIKLNGSSITSASSNVSISGTTATITKAGNYSISGSLSNGQIIVKADTGIVKIQLNGASFANTSGSPFYIKKASKAILFLADGTTNTITDGSTYSYNGEPNAALFSNIYLGIAGSGSLTVNGNYNDGISSDDQVIIHSGKVTVTAKDDAIRGKDYLKIEDGDITATSTEAATSSSSNSPFGSSNTSTSPTGHALKSDNNKTNGLGYIQIDGGTLTLSSSSGDGIHGVRRDIINGGDISISAPNSQGLKSDSLVIFNGGNTNIKSAREGIESPYIKVIDGTLSILASDDGFNSTMGSATEQNDGSMTTFSGGTVYVSTTTGDALDSNGGITMTGGTVIAHGPQSNVEVGIDYNGTFNISGGFLIVSGSYSNMTQGLSQSSPQYSLKIVSGSTTGGGGFDGGGGGFGGGMGGGTTTSSTSLSSTTLFHIQDADGNDILTFQPNKAYSSIIFSSSSLKNGSSYSIYTGGTCSGTSSNGLYTGGTYSNGTLKKTFTVSGSVTSVSL